MSDPDLQYVLIYDGDCGLCRRSVEWVTSADRHRRIRPVPYQDPQVTERFSWIPMAEMEQAMQLVAPGDGERRLQGARAAERLLELLPRWRALAFLFRIPGVRWIAARVYAWVAGNRGRLGCGAHCRLPGEDAPEEPPRPDGSKVD